MSNFADKGGPDKDLPDEQQLDEYLRGGSDVSRQYRQLHSDDVPVDLDRLVLRRAQEAVKEQPAKSRKWMRWAGPLALAASMVLVVSIVIESGVHKETYLTAPVSAPVELPAAAGSAAVAEKKAVEQDKAAGAANDASVVQITPVVPMESPAPMDEMLPEPVAPKVSAPAEERAFAIPQPAPVAAPAPAPQTPSEQPTEEVQVRAQKLERQQLNSSSIAMPVTGSDDLDSDSALQEVAVTGTRRREQQTAGPHNSVVAPTAADAQSDADEDYYSDPERWLRDIRKLRKKHQDEVADREWRRFRYVFPNYEVAKDDPVRGAQP